jgi:hypothetical protein
MPPYDGAATISTATEEDAIEMWNAPRWKVRHKDLRNQPSTKFIPGERRGMTKAALRQIAESAFRSPTTRPVQELERRKHGGRRS